MTFSLALLGCGAVVQDFYLPVLRRLSDRAKVILCVDADPENCGRVAKELGALAAPGGIDQLLSWPPTDGVLISIPNAFHADAILRCMAAARHVFCEKPVVINSAQCDQIEKAVANSDRVLGVDLLRRLFPASVSLRQVLASGWLGKLTHVAVAEGGRGGWKTRSGFQFVRGSSGGGVTLDRGSHIFDLLVHWFGKPTVARYRDDAIGGCECTSVVDLQWPSGFGGNVKMSKSEPWDARVLVQGEAGTVLWTAAKRTAVKLTASGAGQGLEADVRPAGDEGDFSAHDALSAILHLWLGACLGQNPNPTPFAEVRKSIDLIGECYARRELLDLDWAEFKQ